MQLREGTSVFTWDDKDVGHIARVVMNPVSKEVTHVVIRQGFLFTEDKVLPIDYIATASEDRVVLRQDVRDLENLPHFEETHYVPAYRGDDTYPEYGPESAEPVMWYPPVGMAPYHTAGFYGAPAVAHWPYETDDAYTERKEQNIPDDTVAIKDGADVISSDGKHVGDVERVLVDTSSDYASHIVISQGLFFKERKLVPTLWLSTIMDDEVHLSVDSDYIEKLPAYEDEPARG